MICTGRTRDEARAVSLVTRKACKAYLVAAQGGKPKPINPLEALLMRLVYKKTYSQLAENNS